MNPARRPGLRLVAVLVALVMAGCGTSVQRIDTEKVKDLSGAWNDTDSRLVSEEMIEDVLSQPWLRDFTRKHRAQPALIVGGMRNLSHEHINLNTFVADIERAMIRSKKVQFVASPTERGSVRAERKDQDLHATEATRNPMGQELGADFMLQGTINTILDEADGTKVVFYQVDLELVNIENNVKAWFGQKKLKKVVERKRVIF